ncbi:YitT family protein [Brochothrix campestris]|nr:YitT family protein [Brochothrix campestris]
MLVGTLCIAIGIHVFFLPFNIIAGGMNGISILFFRLFNISPDLTLFVSNFPLLLVSFLFLGKKYTLNTIVCAFLLPFFLWLIADMPIYKDNAMLAALFGAVITGAGIGLVFKGGSSTGGTAIIQQIVHNYFHMPLGTAVWLIDGLVLLSSFIFFDLSTGMYSVISLVIIGKMVDLIQTGGQSAKTLFIIANEPKEIARQLIVHHNLGVTRVDSYGAYSNNANGLLISTCPPRKIKAVKRTIKQRDETAFCLVFDTKDVMGNGW